MLWVRKLVDIVSLHLQVKEEEADELEDFLVKSTKSMLPVILEANLFLQEIALSGMFR
jgi:hypothetical protein